MMDIKAISKVILGIVFILIGIIHIIFPKKIVLLIPPSFPIEIQLVYLSGIIAIILGTLLFTNYSTLAAWGIFIWLIAVFPANFYHYQQGPIEGLPAAIQQSKTALLWRLPFQLVYMAWPLWYTFK